MTKPKACQKCGREHPKCKGHNTAGKPCGAYPLPDQEVCKHHGGRSPQALAAARTRAVEREAAEVLRRQRWADGDETPIENPLVELARLAGEAVAFKDFLRGQVTALNGVLSYWSDREVFAAMSDEEMDSRVEQTEQLRAVVTAYERAQDRCARILANIVKLDLAGRMLEFNTAQGAAIANAVRHGLSQVDMPAEVRKGAQAAIGEAIAALSSTPPQPKELTA